MIYTDSRTNNHVVQVQNASFLSWGGGGRGGQALSRGAAPLAPASGSTTRVRGDSDGHLTVASRQLRAGCAEGGGEDRMEQVHRHMAPRARSRRETDSELSVGQSPLLLSLLLADAGLWGAGVQQLTHSPL